MDTVFEPAPPSTYSTLVGNSSVGFSQFEPMEPLGPLPMEPSSSPVAAPADKPETDQAAAESPQSPAQDKDEGGDRSELKAAGKAMAEKLDASLSEGGDKREREGEKDEKEKTNASTTGGAAGRSAAADEKDARKVVRAEPMPLPARGSPGLPRPQFGIDMRVPSFNAVETLPQPQAQAKEEETQNAGPDPKTAASAYAEAVRFGRSYYHQLVTAASDIHRAAEREAQQIHERLDADLSLALESLSGTLSARLASNDQARDRSLARLEALADALKGRIRRAARSAYGRLSKLKKDYEKATEDPRGKRKSLPGQVGKAIADNKSALKLADEAIDKFIKSPATNLTEGKFSEQGRGPWETKAAREAAIEYVKPYAEADKSAIAKRNEVLLKQLTPLADCLPCQLDTAFIAIDGRMDYLMVAGPRAVATAQKGATKRVDDIVEQMTITIEEAHSSTARQLIEQHNSTRKMLIEMARTEEAGLTAQLRAGTQQFTGVLTAIAGSQEGGFNAARAELAKSAGQSPGIYAASVMSGATRLRANVLGMVKSYPSPQLDKARQAENVRATQRRGSQRLREQQLIDFDRALATSIRQTFSQVDASTEREFQRMAKVPAQVASTCDEMLSKAEKAKDEEVKNLIKAVNDLAASVKATIEGTSPPSDNKDGKDKGKDKGDASGKGDGNTADKAKQGSGGDNANDGKKGPPAPPPASCKKCDDKKDKEGDKKQPDKKDPGKDAKNTQDGNKPKDTKPPDGTSGEGDNYMSSPHFQKYAASVTTDPTKAESIDAFVGKVKSQVNKVLMKRKQESTSALDYSWRKPNVDGLMQSLRGLTPTSGGALQEVYRPTDLRGWINRKFNKMYTRTAAAGSTIEFNRNAALNALAGDVKGAALNELRASINYGNENERIREVLKSLTPAQLKDFSKEELDAIAADLDGENLQRFEALRRGEGGLERAITLRDELNKASMKYGTDRGRATQEAIANARRTGSFAIEGDPNRRNADIFGLEHQDEASLKRRRAEQWTSTLQNFANLQQVQYATHYQTADTDPTGRAPQLSDAQRRERYRQPFRHDPNFAEGRSNKELEDIMLQFAAADRYYGGPPRSPNAGSPRPPPGYKGESSGVADRPGRLPPDMVNWIEATIRHGPDSVEERAAHLLVEYNRAEDKGSAERLDQALHIGSADAVEGGGYRPRDTAKADEERRKVLEQFARDRLRLRGDDPAKGTTTAESASEALRDRFTSALSDDPRAQRFALGIISGEQGDPIAAMEYAIDRKDKKIALRYLQRMDRRQIDAMMKEYDSRNPKQPSLYEQLGLFRHRSRGAAFSGDDALELEIAIMGVPQNDRESAEVALRRMDQQIDVSTGAGQTVAAKEFAELEANRDELRRLMGITGSDIDDIGRLRLTKDEQGNSIPLGNFDASGNFRASPGATMAQFQRAVVLGQITAENFTRAVDEAANFITSLLAVVAAVVLTIVTAGAASILLPMLLTAAIGLAGVGMTWALKGGRYSRDDMIRDLANVAVQTLVAGVGAAAGLYMRAGAAGGKAVGTMMGRLSMAEGKLAAQLGMKELAKLTLKQELMLGALTGILGNVGGAMADPRAWREGKVGEEIWHGMFRGAVSGMIGSATMRPLGNMSPDASLGAKIAGRAVLNGVSGSATRAWDLAYDSGRGAYQGSLSDALGEIGTAGATGVIQGGLEAGGEHFGQKNRTLQRFHERGTEAPESRPTAAGGTSKPDTEAPPTDTLPVPKGMGIDENGALVPHGLMHDDSDFSGPRLGTSESDRPEGAGGRRKIPEPANDNPGARPHQISDLSTFDMVTMPKAMEGAVIVHPDSRNLMAANDNFGRLINADPTREVAVHYNPVTGEYVVIQGGPKSVAIILPGGEMKGPGASGRIVSVDGVPSPEGYWIVHSHFHPNRPGETATAMLRRLPSAFDGDFGVLHFESVGLGLGERKSRIYYSDEGRVAYTDFGISPGHPDGKYWIDIPHPQTGERVRKHFETPGDYQGFIKQVRANPDAAVAPHTGGGLATADTDTPRGALQRGSTDTELSPSDRKSIRDLASEIEALGENRKAIDVLRENGASEATIEAARKWSGEAEARSRSMVEQMGLVGEPQSMDRLHHIMNDTTMSPELRQAIGEAVVAATREHMIRAGQLDADEPLMLLFHGAPIGRAKSMAEGGIDLSRVGSGRSDDFGAGLYLTSGVANAESYASKFGQERGAIFPFMMRRRDMGMVVDVRPGGAHRAQWEAFVTANFHQFSESRMTPRMAQAMLEGRPFGFADLDGFGNRGEIFELFLAHLSTTSADPALARPDLVLGELGGPFTTGVGRGDQQAARTAHVADVLNSQMGSRIVGQPEAEGAARPVALRHDDDVDGVTVPREDPDAALSRQVDQDLDRAFAATFDRSVEPETPAQAQQRIATEVARVDAMNQAVRDAVRSFIQADGPDRATQVKARVLRKIMETAPEAAGAILLARGSGTEAEGGRVLSAAQQGALVRELAASGMPPALAERYARAFGRIIDTSGPLHRRIANAVEAVAWGDKLGGLQQRADAALDRRLLLLAARQFAQREGKESAGPRFKEIFRRDEQAVMDFLAATGSMKDRMDAFRRARRIAGATPEQVAEDVRSLVAAIRDDGLQETIDRWRQRYRDAGITVDDLDQIVRAHPEVLMMTARASPDQLADFMARRITELLPEKFEGKRNIDALDFVASFQRGQETGVKSLFSEMEAVRLLAGVPLGQAEAADPTMTLLKSDAINGGKTNQGGLDIVGFQTLPATAEGQHVLQVVVTDDKAVNADTLNSVSAFTDERLRINLLVAASEIRQRAAALHASEDPVLRAFAANSDQAAAQMISAAVELGKLTVPPATDEPAMLAYNREVTRIMEENHISLVITSEYGSIKRVAEWMSQRGIRTYPEYLQWLARRQRGGG